MAQTFVGARSEYLSQIHHTAFISPWLTESWYSTDPWYQALVVIATSLDCSRVGLRESFLLMPTSVRVRSLSGLRERASDGPHDYRGEDEFGDLFSSGAGTGDASTVTLARRC